MKKIYVAPTMVVQKLNAVRLFASSFIEVSGSNATVEVTNTDEGYGGEFYVKETNLWDKSW